MSWGGPYPEGDRVEVYGSLDEARERFGENYQGFVFRVTTAQAEALLRGQVVAFDIAGGEYAGFMVAGEQAPNRETR